MSDQIKQRSTWQRLRKSKGALMGMVIIIAAFIIALFAHLLAPDHSPDANRMILEIGGAKPGYTQKFLLLPKQKSAISKSFLQRLFFGSEDKYTYVPITSSHANTNQQST